MFEFSFKKITTTYKQVVWLSNLVNFAKKLDKKLNLSYNYNSMKYQGILKEELKNKIASDYFGEFDATKIIGKVDFCATEKTNLFEPQVFLWAEAKQGKSDIVKSFVQLILTIGKARTFSKFSPPLFLGAFDAFEMAFVPYGEIQDFFDLNDFNWTVTPSNHKSKEFLQLQQKIEFILQSQSLIFDFEKDNSELREFVKTNFVANRTKLGKIQIDKNNFRTIYLKWVDQVRPSLNFSNWDLARKEANIKDSDFFIADLFTDTPDNFKNNLEAWLTQDGYKYNKITKKFGNTNFDTIDFANKIAHTQFWNKYERPPREAFWNYIIERQDQLLPPEDREIKGAYFTPNFAVEKSQEYLKNIFGEDWQDEYYIWDCCAGSGNLLCNLVEPKNIWASTLDNSDVKSIKALIENNYSPLYPDNVFKFDFLNDSFEDEKVPKNLQSILKDPEKRKKLIIYINPPYAQATSSKTVAGTSQNKTGVSKSLMNTKYKSKIGKAANEKFALFMTRIYYEISGCKLGQFSKLSFVQGDSFADFRKFFLAEYLGGFVLPSKSFDNTSGN